MGDAQNAKNPAPVPLTPDQIREQLDTIARIFEECSDMNRRPVNPANAVAPPVNAVAPPVNGNNPNAAGSASIEPSDDVNGVAEPANDVIRTNVVAHPANGVKPSDDVADSVNGNNPNAVGSAVKSPDVAAQLVKNGNKKQKNVIKTNGVPHPANGVKSSDDVTDPVKNGVAEPVNGNNPNAVGSAVVEPSDVASQPLMNGVAESANDVIHTNGMAHPVNNRNKKKNKKKKNVINANGVAPPVNGDNPTSVGSAVVEPSNDMAPVKNGKKNAIKTNGVAHPVNSDGVAEPVNGNNPNAVDGAVMQPSDDMAQHVNNGVAESSNGADVDNDVIQPSDAVASVKKGKKKRNRKKKNVNPANGVAQPVNNGVGLPANAVIVNNEVVRIPPALLADLANPEGTEFHDTSCRTYAADCVLHVNPAIEYVGLPDPKEESKDPYILVSYLNEKEHLPHIESLMRATLSEPYHIYTYRYFTHHFPDLCHLAFERETGECVGVVLARVEEKRPKADKKAEEKTDKNGNEDNSIEEKPLVDLNAEILVGYGYIGMLAVVPKMRRMGLASRLVRTVLDVMMVKYKCPGAYLDTEVCNEAALRFYAKFGFIKSTYFYKYYLNHNDAYRLLLLFTPTDYKDVLGKLPSLRKAVDPCHHPVIKSHVSSDHLVKYCQPTQLYLRYKPSEGHRIQRPPSYPAYQQLPVAPPEPDLDDELVEEMNREREQATIPEEELNEVLEEPQPVDEEREPTPEPVLTRNQRNKQMRRQRKAQRENGEGTSQEGTSQDDSQEDASQESQEEAKTEDSAEE